jgi:phenylalanyl-tRNA synthetase beta chain
MLNIFLGRRSLPNYRLVAPPDGEFQKLIVKADVSILSIGSLLDRH